MKVTKELLIEMVLEKLPKNSKHKDSIAKLCDDLYCFGYQAGHLDTIKYKD